MPTRAELSEIAEDEDESYTGLMRAALDGDLKTIKALLRAGEDVNARDSLGRAALMFAAINGHAEVTSELIKINPTNIEMKCRR